MATLCLPDCQPQWELKLSNIHCEKQRKTCTVKGGIGYKGFLITLRPVIELHCGYSMGLHITESVFFSKQHGLSEMFGSSYLGF